MMNEHFDLFFAKYGVCDYLIYGNDINNNKGWYRYRVYHDGGWLEGYDIEPVIYWGA